MSVNTAWGGIYVAAGSEDARRKGFARKKSAGAYSDESFLLHCLVLAGIVFETMRRPGCLRETRGFPSPPRDGFGLDCSSQQKKTAQRYDYLPPTNAYILIYESLLET